MNTKNQNEPFDVMDEIEAELTFNISTYGAEAIVVSKVTLGSWDNLARGDGSAGYSIRTVDDLPYSYGSSMTRHVKNIERSNPSFSIEKLKELAANNSLVVLEENGRYL